MNGSVRKISVVIPTYNEEPNVIPISEAVIRELEENCVGYDYEIIFIDNDSRDNTQALIRSLCGANRRIKAIFNAKNFGQFNSPYYALTQAEGDCVILLCADFQDPVDMIHQFVREWEKGYKIVCGIKTTSRENRFVRYLRTCYYRLIRKMSDIDLIEHFTGFGLYDQSFIQVLRELKDPTPFLRGIVAELGYHRKELPYEQQRRRAGRSKNNWYSLYDAAMLSITSYTKIGLRIATFIGFFIAAVCVVVALVYFVLKLLYWDTFFMGTAPILIGVFLLGAIQLMFMGFIGEYILSINQRQMNRPLVVEEERINFDS